MAWWEPTMAWKEMGAAIPMAVIANPFLRMRILFCEFQINFLLREWHLFYVQALPPIPPFATGRLGRVQKSGFWAWRLGHMAVKLASSMGAEVTMLSHSPSKEADSKRLGAKHFVLMSDPQKAKSVTGYFDFIIDTVSAEHDYNFYLTLLRTNGVMVCVGAPPVPATIPAFNLIFGRKSFAGSLIGGIPETQEMLDYCAEHGIVSDVEVIPIKDINLAYERMLKSDVKYRFVIDMATL